MINLVKKDLKLNFAIKSSVISLATFLPLMLIIMRINEGADLYPFMILSYGYILTNMPLKYDARDKQHILIQSLPVKKKDIVVSKYIAMIIYYLISLAYAWLVFNLLDLIGFSLSKRLTISTIKETFFIFMIVSSMSMPIYLRLPPKLGNIVNVIIYVTMLNLFVFMPGGNDLVNIIHSYSGDWLIMITIISILYFVSMGISILLYETRDFY